MTSNLWNVKMYLFNQDIYLVTMFGCDNMALVFWFDCWRNTFAFCFKFIDWFCIKGIFWLRYTEWRGISWDCGMLFCIRRLLAFTLDRFRDSDSCDFWPTKKNGILFENEKIIGNVFTRLKENSSSLFFKYWP